MTGLGNNPQLARFAWLALPLALVVALHVGRLPLWIGLMWLGCALWRGIQAARRYPRVPRWPALLLALPSLVGILLEYRTLIGPEAGVGLLVLLTGLKLLETRDARDHGILVLVGYFLLLAGFLEDQSLPVAAYAMFSALALTASLASLHGEAAFLGRLQFRRHFGTAAMLLLQALPLTLALFVLVPRIPAPLGGLIQIEHAQSGLSDQMSPGSISRLMLSNQPAFRAEFAAGAKPASETLYWRGPVFWHYDGLSWREGGSPRPADPFDLEPRGEAIEYRVTLEPHAQRWLFVAGLATELAEANARLTADLQWLADKPVKERLHYRVKAHPDYRLDAGGLSAADRARALALPEGRNPKTHALARAWAARGDAAAVVDEALRHFRTQPFRYTLNPPHLGEHAMDDFMFASRAGYCEHYSSAFVVLMRAAGIPARVVTGYQGGEYNAIGEYWIVRGRDAHAWAEVWLEDEGWRRVDPTAAIAPERVESGSVAALPRAERPFAMIDIGWLKPVRLAWDTLNNRWNLWVIGFNHERQRQFLAGIHPTLASLEAMLWAALGIAALFVLVLLAGLLGPAGSRDRDAASRLYARFCKRLARIGLVRAASEGPRAFARRAAQARPDLARAIGKISELYVGVRYAGAGEDELIRLRRAVRAFRPAPRPTLRR